LDVLSKLSKTILNMPLLSAKVRQYGRITFAKKNLQSIPNNSSSVHLLLSDGYGAYGAGEVVSKNSLSDGHYYLHRRYSSEEWIVPVNTN
jgi:hypothetical protein